MKSAMKYMMGAAAGIGMYMLYEKYGSMLMKDMKEAANCVENMASEKINMSETSKK